MGSIEQENENKMAPEQEQHIVDLIQFLIGTHNALVATVKGHSEDQSDFVVDAAGFNSVLDSLNTTANNFAVLIGATISNDKQGEQEQDIGE